MTFGVISDIHAHNWSIFQKQAPNGVNGRLQIILNEVDRACDTLLDHGGNTMIIPGDVFHVRGSIDPEVLNPFQRCIRRNLEKGISFEAIPGNHDLKSKDTTELGNAIQTLGETFSASGEFRVINEPCLIPDSGHPFAFVPWASSNEILLYQIDKLATQAGADVGKYTLFIHAGIDGVLIGMPEHGLTSAKLASYGFGRVFAGHYHNHKVMEGGTVISCGATTHQTWSDVGSKAGFSIIDNGNHLRFFDTHAPKFVDVSGLDETDMALQSDGNYVRFRGAQMTQEQIKELREFFESSGALGVSIQVPKVAISQRVNAPKSSAQTLDQSVTSYVDQDTNIPAHVDRAEVKRQAVDVLTAVRAVVEE